MVIISRTSSATVWYGGSPGGRWRDLRSDGGQTSTESETSHCFSQTPSEMSVPRLLDPIALAEKGPNNVRTLALGYFGEVARALANDYQLTLIPPDTLGMDSLLEWRDAIAEEVLLLAQMDRDR